MEDLFYKAFGLFLLVGGIIGAFIVGGIWFFTWLAGMFL